MSLQSSPIEIKRNESNVVLRVDRTLARFQSLPADALVDVRVVSALLGRSIASIWRDVANGRLANPIRIGARSTRWRVGDVRVAMHVGADLSKDRAVAA